MNELLNNLTENWNKEVNNKSVRSPTPGTLVKGDVTNANPPTSASDGIKSQVYGLIVVVIKEYCFDRELFNSINLNIMIRREINCKIGVFKG